MHGRFGGGFGFPFWIIGTVVLLALIGVAVWAVLSRRRPGKETPGPMPKSPQEEAFAILTRRFANGEISAEEYTERVEVLRGAVPGTEI